MGLHVCEFSAEKLLGTLNAQSLHLIDMLATTVITLAGQTFRVFIGKDGTHCGDHSGRSKVLGGNQFQTVLLARQFAAHHGRDFGIKLRYKSDRIQGFSVHSKILLSY